MTVFLIEKAGCRGQHPGKNRRLYLLPPIPPGHHVDNGINTQESLISVDMAERALVLMGRKGMKLTLRKVH